MWSSIVKKDPPSKPPTTAGAPAAILGLVGNCKSTKGISIAVVDANAVIEGSLNNFVAEKFVTVPEVLHEIRDHDSRRRLDFITIETMEPSLESLSKVVNFSNATGDFGLSDVDRKVIALTYTLEAQFHGTKHLRDVPLPIQTVRVKRSLPEELPGWGSNVANLEEWEALENDTEEKPNMSSKILPLQDLDINITEDQAEDEQEGEIKKIEVKLAGKMVVEGIDASRGEYDDEDSCDWRPAVSSSTHRKFLRRKAKWEHYNALAEQEVQKDQEAEKTGNFTQDTTTDLRSSEQDSFKNLQEGLEDTNGEDDVEVEAEGNEQSLPLRALPESSVACITSDYAMQNVILQMGLRLLAPGGKQIRQLKRWILRCHACYTVTHELGRNFCPKCGNAGTLIKVAVTIDENGTTIVAGTPRIKLQGTKFSIPMPKSGRDAITKNLVLREDQLPLHPKTKKKATKPGDEYFVSDDVFMNHHSNKKAPLQPPVRETMAILRQKRNPNDNHYSRSMH
ncbi:hypothetical protein CARUB_v10025467mg [Capsella rubella]|uniref:RNA-binding protein NOB1 n=1 Tax=Capsella rubella TaxID=81985 RepID=R0HUV2_9BRAS|nr:RNA-binding protein NOB1 [Capsella rubella]EOA29195.1 hypothetical protein CARUB_v10025467mg [Capsella rubella]